MWRIRTIRVKDASSEKRAKLVPKYRALGRFIKTENLAELSGNDWPLTKEVN
jgi:hypothetical protein